MEGWWKIARWLPSRISTGRCARPACSCVIVTYEEDRELAWTIESQLSLGHVYGYRLEPIEGGTLVSSYYDWSGIEEAWRDADIFPVIPESALRATLGILARTVAPGAPRPGA